jgi:hypothetical protein
MLRGEIGRAESLVVVVVERLGRGSDALRLSWLADCAGGVDEGTLGAL